eukprot:460396_1
MAYVRGCSGDYDYWSNELGCDGWSADEVWPIFTQHEEWLETSLDGEQRGKDGPLKVRFFPESHLRKPLLKACEEAGHPVQYDHNNGDCIGFAAHQATINEDMQRVNAAEAFLREAEQRPNLTVVTNALVGKVIISDAMKATGVEYFRDTVDARESSGFGEPDTRTSFAVSARREVIVCAGAIHTPHILMLSGIGPRKELER